MTDPDPAQQPAFNPVQDLRDIESLDIVTALLEVVCETAGVGFAAIARVTETTWTAMAVRDAISFGLKPGEQLDIHSTLCKEVRQSRQVIVIDQASLDPVYANHHTPRLFGIESYISVPIVLSDGMYFGNLCALDRRPARMSEARIVNMFSLFARLIALQLENHRRAKEDAAVLGVERANSALREQFIAIMGHDLRNPLAGMQAGVTVLQRVPNDPDIVGRIANRMAGSVRRMSLLVDDVVDFARGRLGGGFGLDLRWEEGLDEALDHVVAELRSIYPDRRVEARIRIDQAVRCDKSRVEQLVSNLLANALFHGDATSPVELNADVDGDLLRIAVTNQGEAIDPAFLPRMFEAYSQGRMSGSRNGLGLGLFICAQVARGHGGTIAVSSSVADGTRFVAALPLAGPA
ncbi:hypothetical protein CDN99_21635 [Roseateles aquatilis]|uniref:histidine kinase n=1 Tax=Roseateles aquatilis TaxID=431061 RepID=A0A246IZI7_9BURK|nr:GAF domain-containing sensor histidine kinase [Roseateles aquatilis]OWQ85758.1 hypothetical protein CDN99_21635 [Roseateles aquatilis]